jgi:REP element-mobilizing transposase RayT
VQYFEGGSSKTTRKEYTELGEFLWADGYFAETVGQTQEEIIKKYIREQKTPK